MTKNAASRIVLASASPYRAAMLRNAGVQFETSPAQIGERAIEAALEKSAIDAAGVALALARAKASNVSTALPGRVVIGADQTLCFNGAILHKPATMDEAVNRLMLLSEQTHQLTSAACLVRNEELLWAHVETSHITFRRLEPGFITRHLAVVGKTALTSVGAYQIEGQGIQLIEKIEGDFFSIVGMPLLPLLAQLRQMGLTDG